MEKPKIISMKDAFDLPAEENEVPELPGRPQTSPASSEPEEYLPEVPPERVIPRTAASMASAPVESVAAVSGTAASAEPAPVSVAESPKPAAPVAPAVVLPLAPASVQPPTAPSDPASVQSASDVIPPEPEPAQPPAGAPPWVGREPPVPTVAEAVKSVAVYPGVGRPRINSISQGAVSFAPPRPVTAPIRPAPVSASTPSAGKLYDRPELDADRFAAEMAEAKDATPAKKDVVAEYRQAALPPRLPARPLTPDEERAKAKSLAAQIHSDNQKQGFFGKVKRMLGLR